jgi:rhodanese-related sulfurtransferase
MSAEAQSGAPTTPEISREELCRRLREGSFRLVDVLPAESYATAHIPGAIGIPFEELAERAPALLPDLRGEIVVYCGKFT